MVKSARLDAGAVVSSPLTYDSTSEEFIISTTAQPTVQFTAENLQSFGTVTES